MITLFMGIFTAALHRYAAAITLILGTLVMTGWVTGLYYLASFGLSSIPMAPGTSLAFILLGAHGSFISAHPHAG